MGSVADTLSLPCTVLKGIGPKLAQKLRGLNIHTIQDLLLHLPARYQDRTKITPIGQLRAGMEALISGVIENAHIHYGRRRAYLCHISDGTGLITLRLFYFNAAQLKKLVPSAKLVCFGEARFGPNGREMIHPEYHLHNEENPPQPDNHLTPIYPVTTGLRQNTLRKLVEQALALALPKLQDIMPPALSRKLALPNLQQAVLYLHRPEIDADRTLIDQQQHPAQLRLAFEELLAHQLGRIRLREQIKTLTAPRISAENECASDFIAQLPFALTAAQRRVIDEILRDLASGAPMHRLLQGDVGSGKTVVAATIALHAVAAGYQVAFMAPTELLAEQHAANFIAWFKPLGICTIALSGKKSSAAREEALVAIARSDAQMIIGTHALFQQDVNFAQLGLVIIDEQHRFGVAQRLTLLEKGHEAQRHPHQLIMTATPIPRTLAQTFYADLDVSTIDELPAGRQPIETAAVSEARRDEIIARIANVCAKGQQVYWVCPLIEEQDDEQEATRMHLQNVQQTAETLTQALPKLHVACVHGRVKGKEKNETMRRFKAGEIDLLVATTVIEVGIDVPNACLMIIENAERLGLAQLHQLRGRVGRGVHTSCCVMLYHAPLSDTAKKRLAAMRETQDGFKIASRDLEIRGPGEFFGVKQAGAAHFRIADLIRHRDLLPQVRWAAEQLRTENTQEIDALIKRWVSENYAYNSV